MKKTKSKIAIIMIILILATLLVNFKFIGVIKATNETTWDISATESDNVTAKLDGDTLNISGTGKMKDFDNIDVDDYWHNSDIKDTIKNIIIEKGVTNIGKSMANTLFELKSVEISDTVTVIGASAFVGCYELESISIPESVLYIERCAFAMSGVKNIEIPKSVISVGSLAFWLSDIESANILNGDTILLGDTIEEPTFYQCTCDIDQPERKTTVKTKPTKLQYKAGEEIDLTGGVLEIKTETETKEVSMTDSNIEYVVENYGYIADEDYGQDVIVIYTENENKYFTYFTIKVSDRVEKISVKKLPKTEYVRGDELNLTDGIIESQSYATTKKEIKMTNSSVKVTGYDKDKVGTQTLTVTYTVDNESYTTTFDVTVTEDFCINLGDETKLNSCVFGDINLDGYLTTRDITGLERFNVVGEYGSGLHNTNADVNLDNIVGLRDVIILKGFIYQEGEVQYNIDGANELKVGSELQLALWRENGYDKFDGVTWTSSDESVATIDQNGKITALAKGKTMITVKNQYAEDKMVLYVVNEYGDISKNGDGSIIATVNGTTLSIKGTGEMKDFASTTPWWKAKRYDNKGYHIKKVEIQEGITNIGEYALYNLVELTSVTIPTSVKNIGDSAFSSSIKLENIIIPQEVQNIGENVFNYCKGPLIVTKGSYAEQYAKGITYIKYRYPGNNIEDYFDESNIIDITYTGKDITQKIVIKNGTVELEQDTDYTVSYENNKNAGTATITIVGKDNYTGTITKTFKITAKNISNATITGIENKAYTGEELTQNIVVKIENTELKKDTDYTVSYQNNKNAGTATITITGKDNYTGTITKTFKITAKSISNATVTGIEDKEYTGKELTQNIVVKIDNTELKKDTDYTVSYKNNKNAGMATITITGKDNYTGTITKTFKITAKSISNATVTGIEDKTYTGEELKQDIVVKIDNTELKKDTDYTVSYQNNKNAGTATITIAGKDNYTGTITKTFEVTAKSISNAKITGIENKAYTGEGIIQSIVVKVDDIKLVEGKDYFVNYFNNYYVGTATITITGQGNYTGTITKTFKITEKTISKAKVTGIKDKEYTGKNLTQNIVVKVDNVELLQGVDYIVSYKNNKNTGKATVTIKGEGNYAGTITKTFIIKPKKITGFKASSQTTSSIKLSWTKHTGVTGYKVYSYNYSSEKWEYVGKTSSTSYTVKKLKAGTTYKYRVRAYKTIDGKDYYGAYTSNIKTTTKTKTPSISSLTTKSKKATIKWKKISGATGYEIYMATSKNGKYSKIKTITKGSTVSYTKSDLTKNKKYYFKIRTYRTVDGKKVYSSYSSVKSIKIK